MLYPVKKHPLCTCHEVLIYCIRDGGGNLNDVALSCAFRRNYKTEFHFEGERNRTNGINWWIEL